MPLFLPPQLGDEFDATNSVSLGVGDFVYISGSRATEDDLYFVDLADPTTLDKMPAIGMVVEVYSATECHVKIRGFADPGSGSIQVNRMQFVGLDGKLSSNPPNPSSGSFFVQIVGLSSDQNQIFLEPNWLITRRHI